MARKKSRIFYYSNCVKIIKIIENDLESEIFQNADDWS